QFRTFNPREGRTRSEAWTRSERCALAAIRFVGAELAKTSLYGRSFKEQPVPRAVSLIVILMALSFAAPLRADTEMMSSSHLSESVVLEQRFEQPPEIVWR